MDRREYYEMQKTNLDYPNEEYINDKRNVNQADLFRFNFCYENNKDLCGKMMDVGCNDGFFMRNYDWKFDEYVGIDMFSIDEYTKGRYNINPNDYNKGGKIKYMTGLIEDMELPLNEFDFIFAGEILEHVIDPPKFVKKVSTYLKRGGMLFLLLPITLVLNIQSICGNIVKSN